MGLRPPSVLPACFSISFCIARRSWCLQVHEEQPQKVLRGDAEPSRCMELLFRQPQCKCHTRVELWRINHLSDLALPCPPALPYRSTSACHLSCQNNSATPYALSAADRKAIREQGTQLSSSKGSGSSSRSGCYAPNSTSMVKKKKSHSRTSCNVKWSLGGLSCPCAV